jgi:hypothetical protein
MARRSTANTSASVSIRGFSAFRRGLRSLDVNLDRQLRDYIKEMSEEVASVARQRAPRKSGKLSKSIKSSVTQTRASVYSNLPYAAVQEWGGTIRPKGVPIKIEGRQMIYSAVKDKSADVEDHMGRLFDSISSTSGF